MLGSQDGYTSALIAKCHRFHGLPVAQSTVLDEPPDEEQSLLYCRHFLIRSALVSEFQRHEAFCLAG